MHATEVAGSLPGGDQAFVRHLGAHDTLGWAYEVLARFAANREPAVPPGEVYELIPQHKAPNPADWPPPGAWSIQHVQPLVRIGAVG